MRGYVLERARELVHGLGQDLGRGWERARERRQGPEWARTQEQARARQQDNALAMSELARLPTHGRARERQEDREQGWGLER